MNGTVQEPPAMPPVEQLLALETFVLWQVVLYAVAGTGLGVWKCSNGRWALGSHVDAAQRWLQQDENGHWYANWLPPSPLVDPAAAWELAERELGQMDVRTRRVRWGWDVPYVPQSRRPVTGVALRPEQWGPWHTDRKRAACLAVLHKHKDGPYKSLIISLLERIKEEGLDK